MIYICIYIYDIYLYVKLSTRFDRTMFLCGFFVVSAWELENAPTRILSRRSREKPTPKRVGLKIWMGEFHGKKDITWVVPPPRIPVVNEGFGWDPQT